MANHPCFHGNDDLVHHPVETTEKETGCLEFQVLVKLAVIPESLDGKRAFCIPKTLPPNLIFGHQNHFWVFISNLSPSCI